MAATGTDGTTGVTTGTALDPPARFVVVGGLPGAGKSTAIRSLQTDQPGLRVLDPEQVTTWLRDRVGPRAPYRVLRVLSHTIHALRVLLAVLLGPSRGPVVVHDTATRRRRTAALGALAVVRGWQPCLVVLQVAPELARAGQRHRGRVVGARAFEQHCRRWSEQRRRGATGDTWAGSAWREVLHPVRAEASGTLRRLLVVDAHPGHERRSLVSCA